MPDPSFQFDSDALKKHTQDIEAVVERLRKFYDAPDASGLAFVATEWNRLLEESEREGAEHQRELLKDDYLWYRTLQNYEQEYRRQIAEFLDRVRHERKSEFARTSFARRPADDAVGKLELALSEVSGTINLAMPGRVRREGSGSVTLVWQDRGEQPDAELFWEPEGERIGLRSAIASGLRYSARLSHDDVSFFTGSLIDEICNVHELEIPEFHYERGLAFREPPARLRWERSETTLAGSDELPEWMTDEGPAPKELELEHAVSGRDPVLAELIDRVLCAAALEDHYQSEKLSREERAQRVSAVEQLVNAVAQRVGTPREEVVRLFAPALVDRQSRAEGRAECAANTSALQFLLSQLTEH
jgi:hypothetical protein